ncbi:V protein [avian paramyxovirus 5]|uniref:V protein n=1 Tax=avian paramyxovirus 5 TaxID=2560315 RepID=D3X604_9MONO|nr:V protein [Avian metaavulavirus 5]ADD39007.1 V protein [Avian metaavulavirus 5]
MDITDDQAILDLLTLSNDVIESIQHAESAGSQPPTYGRSTIPKGTTMALTQAWEAESNPTQPQPSISPSQLDHIRVDQDSNKNHDNLKNQFDSHHHTSQDSETHPNIQVNPSVNRTNEEDNSKLVQQRDPSTTWEGGSMLDRELDAIQSKIKRGKTTKSAHQPSHTATHQSPNNLDDDIKKGAQTSDNRDHTYSKSPTTKHTAKPNQDRLSNQKRHRFLPTTFPGHRREYSLFFSDGRCSITEWCNPTCRPITAIPSVQRCTCGECPRRCSMCWNDS